MLTVNAAGTFVTVGAQVLHEAGQHLEARFIHIRTYSPSAPAPRLRTTSIVKAFIMKKDSDRRTGKRVESKQEFL